MPIDALLRCRLNEFYIKYSRRDILAYITPRFSGGTEQQRGDFHCKRWLGLRASDGEFVEEPMVGKDEHAIERAGVRRGFR